MHACLLVLPAARFYKTAIAALAGMLSTAALANTQPPSQALEISPTPDGETHLFTRIPAEASGLLLVNDYSDPAMWGAKFQEFKGGAVGTGIAAGDYDNDGLPDLYIVSKSSPNKLYRQSSPFHFEDVTARAGVPGGDTWGTGATFADIDNDGDLDLYICQFNAPNILYRNNGDGSFTDIASEAGLAISAGSVCGNFEDYDRDGDLDLFLVTNVSDAYASPQGDPDYLLRNNGDGTFTDVTTLAGVNSDKAKGHSAIWWDADNDGWPDLYIANDFEAPDYLYRNNRDGTFTDIADTHLPHTPWFSMGADVADIDNNGHFDLFVADMAATTHYKRQTTMASNSSLAQMMDTMPTPQYMVNAFYLNTGSSGFLEAARLIGISQTDWTWSVLFEDLDNDGWQDLHVTNGMIRNFIDADLIDRLRLIRSNTQAAAILKRSPILEEENISYRNTGDLRFEKTTQQWGLQDFGVSFGAVLVDLDRDGDLDLVYTNLDKPVSLYRNNSQGNRITVKLNGTESNSFGVGARIFADTTQGRQSRILTLSRGVLSSGECQAHIGLGTASSVKRLEIHWPSGRTRKLENLGANQSYTFTEPATSGFKVDPTAKPLFSQKTHIPFKREELSFDETNRQPLLPRRMNKLGGGLAFADADGDGDPDLYLTGAKGQTGRLYLNQGDGSFLPDSKSQPWNRRMDTEEMAPLWMDANQDGQLDLVVSSGGVENNEGDAALENRLYVNDGYARFRESETLAFPKNLTSSSTLAAADFDRDGDLDLFIGGLVTPAQYPLSPASQLLENQDGQYVPIAEDKAPGLSKLGRITSAVWSDANNDGWLDLLIAGEWQSLRLFLNREGKGFEDGTSASGLSDKLGWWNAIEPADIDQDGDMDYIACNLGLNTAYQASADRPIHLYYGDFDESGTKNLLEAYYEKDHLYPVRGLNPTAKAMPVVRMLFPKHKDYAAAELPEIHLLDNALKLTANELASGIFINDGTAHFSFRPLPRIAQIAPAFGIAARDFNGDSFIDLLLAQNDHGTRIGSPRFDGGRGLLLFGNGRGEFTAVPSATSGIDIPGQGRGLAVADWNRDGWPDAAVIRIQATAIAFTNEAQLPGRNAFALKLTAPPGNPNATGTIIELTYENGAIQKSELHSGSGYLSQSEALAFFGYTDDNLPASIAIRWPSGDTQTLPWKKAALIEWKQPVSSH